MHIMNSTPYTAPAHAQTRRLLALSALAAVMAWPVASFAQNSTAANTAVTVANESAPAVSAGMTDGEVKKINLDTGKITIKHGPIAHIDMPGMTMVFTAKDKNLLTNLKLGDKIKFMAVDENRKMVVTDIKVQ
jgi:Cu(I)/Ag(I) efflux system protein CusF